jgi:putative redox protein
MKISLKRKSGAQYYACNEAGEEIAIGGPPDVGDSEEGPRPMQLVLMGLAGCSAVDVQLILQRGRHQLDSLEIHIDSERASTTPAVFEKIHLSFRAGGDFSLKKLERAVKLSMEKYCSVARMLESTAVITHSCELVNTEEG